MAMPFVGRGQEQYQRVETSDLLKTPPKYWARLIIFKDTLTKPPENMSVDIEGKRYRTFSTREVGVCYLSAHLPPVPSDLEVGHVYLFSGTIFKYRGRYVPIVHSYIPAMDTQELSKDTKTATVTESTSPSEIRELSNEVEKTSASLTTNVAPKKLSWSERRMKARTKKLKTETMKQEVMK